MKTYPNKSAPISRRFPDGRCFSIGETLLLAPKQCLIDVISKYARRIAVVLLATFCGLAMPLAQTLHFKSGFEAGTTVIKTDGEPPAQGNLSAGIKFSGLDGTTGFDWTDDLNKDDPTKRLGTNRFNLDTTGEGAHITVIDDPTNSGRGKVARFWLRDPTTVKGRVQMNINGNDVDLNEVTSVVKVYFHPELAVLGNSDSPLYQWWTIQELFILPDWTNPDYRIGIGLMKPSGGTGVYWQIGSDTSGPNGTDYWKYNSVSQGQQVPFGEWITLLMYYKKGDASTGKMKLKYIRADGTEQPLFDVTNWTMPDPARDPDLPQGGLTHHMPMKMYTGKETVDYVRENTTVGASIIYWDDWEYYEGDAYTNYGASSPPSAASELTAVAVSSTQVDLAWPDVANESQYRIERKVGVGAFEPLTTKGANSTAHVDSTVLASTGYLYQIRAENANGNSSWTASNSVTTPASPGGGEPVTHEFESLTIPANTDTYDVRTSDVLFHADGTGDYITFNVPNLTSGTYAIDVKIQVGPNRGVFQLESSAALGGTYEAHGSAVDTFDTTWYTQTLVVAPSVTFGTSDTRYFRFRVVGKNASSTGYKLAPNQLILTPAASDTTPPDVFIEAPANGASVSGTAVTVSAIASDDVGVEGVQFKLDGVNLGEEVTNSPYSFPWNSTTANDGSYTLTAVARDAAGNTKTSSGIAVTVDNSAPSVSITEPAVGTTVSGESVAVSASATDNEGVVAVQFKLDGADLGAEDFTAPYSISWNTTTASFGSHTLTAVARDAAGNDTTSAAISVNVDNGGGTIIAEAFDTSPASNFTVVAGGTWSVTGGQYVLTNPATGTAGQNGNIAIHNTSVTGDWTLTVDASTTNTSSSWNDFAVIFGYQDSANYYFVQFNESNDTSSSGVFKVASGVTTELIDITSLITGGTTYAVKIVKAGATYEVYRDSVLVAAITDSTFTSGKVGCGTRNDGATYDNLIVTPADAIIAEAFDTSPASNFTVVAGGTWSVTGGQYVLTNPATGTAGQNGNIAIHNTSVTGDWTLTVDASTTNTSSSWNDFAVIFGYQDSASYYFVQFNESNDTSSSGVFKVASGVTTELVDITSLITGGTTYAVKVVKAGATYEIYRDSLLVAAITDSTFTSGKVGFGTRNDGATYDNLIVVTQ